MQPDGYLIEVRLYDCNNLIYRAPRLTEFGLDTLKLIKNLHNPFSNKY